MIILNTTFAIERSLYDSVVQWIADVYVPAATNTGLFSSPRIARIITNDHPETVSVACEMACQSLAEAVRWHDQTATLLRQDLHRRWGNRVLEFSTFMETVSDNGLR